MKTIDKTPHEITIDLLIAAKLVLGNHHGQIPSQAALDMLMDAVMAFEAVHVKRGTL